MRVYLCGPMDWCKEDEARVWREHATKYLCGIGITTLNPLDRSNFREHSAGPTSALPDLVEEDKMDIEMSDVVLVNYTKIGAGTCMEILLGWQKDKRVVVVAPPGTVLSPWVHYHSHKIFDDIHDAYDDIAAFNHRIGQ